MREISEEVADKLRNEYFNHKDWNTKAVLKISPVANLFLHWIITLVSFTTELKKHKAFEEALISRYSDCYWCEIKDVKQKGNMVKVSFIANGRYGTEGPL